MTIRDRRLFFAVTAVVLSASFSQAGPTGPRIGEVRHVTVITIALDVGSTEKEAKRVTYTPPPGWYVRSHAVECKEKTGHSSFTVNTVPQDWTYATEEQVRESFRTVLDLATQARDVGIQTRLLAEREAALNEVRRCRSSHHALVVEATAKGEGFWRSGGKLLLTVTAELVYIGVGPKPTPVATTASYGSPDRR